MGTDDYTTALNTKHEKIIRDLQELQAVETYLFTKIQEAASSHKDSDEQQKISSHISKLSHTRTTLLKELQSLYDGANDDVTLSSSICLNKSNNSCFFGSNSRDIDFTLFLYWDRLTTT